LFGRSTFRLPFAPLKYLTLENVKSSFEHTVFDLPRALGKGQEKGAYMKQFILSVLLLLVAVNIYAATAEEYYSTGLGFYQQGQYDQAAQYFRAAVQVNPNHWQAYQVLGNIYAAKGDNANALAAFQTSLQINPNNPTLAQQADQIKSLVPGAGNVNNVVKEERRNLDSFFEKHRIFFQVGGFVSRALLGDIEKAKDFWSEQDGIWGNDTTTANGAFAELGYAFDPCDALSLSFNSNFNGSVIFAYHRNPVGISYLDTFYQEIQTKYICVGLGYYRFLPDKDGRWFAKGEIEYYMSDAGYQLNVRQGGVTVASMPNTTLKGSAIGGSISIGRQLPLFWILGLELSGRVQYANIDKFIGDYPGLPGHKLALAAAPDGSIGGVDEEAIGTGGLRYASMDWSGFEFRGALMFCF
jgi:tetratricopeptide (TPR) repeat protein